jgi:hypothetical protein
VARVKKLLSMDNASELSYDASKIYKDRDQRKLNDVTFL